MTDGADKGFWAEPVPGMLVGRWTGRDRVW